MLHDYCIYLGRYGGWWLKRIKGSGKRRNALPALYIIFLLWHNNRGSMTLRRYGGTRLQLKHLDPSST